MTGNDKNSCYSIYDKNPSEKGHSATHVNININTGKSSIVEHESDGKTTTTDIICFLTTVCMRKLKESFDDNCYELRVLRWFRDNFVSDEDIKHYYVTAPIIVSSINSASNNDIVYDYIYDNVVDFCVTAIENGDYKSVYNRYKNSVLSLEETFAKPILQDKLVKTLKLVNN